MRDGQYHLFDIRIAIWTKLPKDMPKPSRVWFLLDRLGFDKLGPIHGRTASLTDEMHDWNYHRGQLKFQSGGARGELVTLILET